MKILMVAESIERAGGSEEYLDDIVKGLGGFGHTVLVFYLRPVSPGSPPLPGLSKISYRLKNADPAGFVGKLRKFDPDVVNFQGVVAPNLLKASLNLFPTTVFLHNHESYCPGNSKFFFNSATACLIPVSPSCILNAFREKCMTRNPVKMFRSIRRRGRDLDLLRGLSHIFCNSGHVKKNLVVNGVKEESVTVNHLFPRLYEGEITEETASDGLPVVLFVGRLFKEKGVDHLLKSLTGLNLPFRAVIVGEGWEKANLVSLARDLKIDRKVDFRGFCSREEVARLYRKSSLLVIPSLWPEPFGMVGLEAGSFGLPVVAYRSGGIPEWLTDGLNGFLVERGDINGLAKKIEILLEDRYLASRLGEGGRMAVRERFSLKRHLDCLVDVYLKMTRQGRS